MDRFAPRAIILAATFAIWVDNDVLAQTVPLNFLARFERSLDISPSRGVSRAPRTRREYPEVRIRSKTLIPRPVRYRRVTQNTKPIRHDQSLVGFLSQLFSEKKQSGQSQWAEPQPLHRTCTQDVSCSVPTSLSCVKTSCWDRHEKIELREVETPNTLLTASKNGPLSGLQPIRRTQVSEAQRSVNQGDKPSFSIDFPELPEPAALSRHLQWGANSPVQHKQADVLTSNSLPRSVAAEQSDTKAITVAESVPATQAMLFLVADTEDGLRCNCVRLAGHWQAE